MDSCGIAALKCLEENIQWHRYKQSLLKKDSLHLGHCTQENCWMKDHKFTYSKTEVSNLEHTKPIPLEIILVSVPTLRSLLIILKNVIGRKGCDSIRVNQDWSVITTKKFKSLLHMKKRISLTYDDEALFINDVLSKIVLKSSFWKFMLFFLAYL